MLIALLLIGYLVFGFATTMLVTITQVYDLGECRITRDDLKYIGYSIIGWPIVLLISIVILLSLCIGMIADLTSRMARK